VLEESGMASFADVLSSNEAGAIRSYVVDWAQRSRRGASEESQPDAGVEPGAARSKGL
jgi:mono/diheme cytochrome c family protein